MRVTRRGLLGFAAASMAAALLPPGLLRPRTGQTGAGIPGLPEVWFEVRRGAGTLTGSFDYVEGSVSRAGGGWWEVRPARPLDLRAGDVVSVHYPGGTAVHYPGGAVISSRGWGSGHPDGVFFRHGG